jgi:hypothetical protein
MSCQTRQIAKIRIAEKIKKFFLNRPIITQQDIYNRIEEKQLKRSKYEATKTRIII